MNGSATFGKDLTRLALREQYRMQDNFMWTNADPRQQGNWLHSTAARTFGLAVPQ